MTKMYVLSITDPQSKKGIDTAEYKAFMGVSTSLTETIESTPGTHGALLSRFKQKGWIPISATPSASDLVTSACNKIKQKASEYETIFNMLKEVEGMDIVIEDLKGTTCYHFLVVYTKFLPNVYEHHYWANNVPMGLQVMMIANGIFL